MSESFGEILICFVLSLFLSPPSTFNQTNPHETPVQENTFPVNDDTQAATFRAVTHSCHESEAASDIH